MSFGEGLQFFPTEASGSTQPFGANLRRLEEYSPKANHKVLEGSEAWREIGAACLLKSVMLGRRSITSGTPSVQRRGAELQVSNFSTVLIWVKISLHLWTVKLSFCVRLGLCC